MIKKLKKFLSLTLEEKLIYIKSKVLIIFKKFLNFFKIKIIIKRYNTKFLIFQDEISDAIFIGNYENDLLSMLKEMMIAYLNKQNKIYFVDVGAHMGWYSVILSNFFKNRIETFCFEPNSLIFKFLEENVRLNKLNNIVLENKALLNTSGKNEFYVALRKTGLSSFGIIEEDLTEKIIVDVTTLDDYFQIKNLPNVDFIKIYAEGSEKFILEGSKLVLNKCRPIILLEVSDKRTKYFNYPAKTLLYFLHDQEYLIFEITDKYLNQILFFDKNWDANLFCIPKEKISTFWYLLKNPPAFISFASTPKPYIFKDINTIQNNAILSWLKLEPEPEILLLTRGSHIEKLFYKFNFKNYKIIQNFKTNKYGTPLVDDIFLKVQKYAKYDIICYLNTDIILTQDFINSIKIMVREIRNRFLTEEFLIVGRRTDLKIDKEMDFKDGWDLELKERAEKEGKLLLSGIDYFIFSKGFFDDLPPFNLGRGEWDNYLVFYALERKAIVIDATKQILVIHQSHHYKHHPFGEEKAGYGIEESENQYYAKDVPHRYQIFDAPYLFYKNKLRFNILGYYKIKSKFYIFLDKTRGFRSKLLLTKTQFKTIYKKIMLKLKSLE